MFSSLARISDRMLAVLVPRGEAAAAAAECHPAPSKFCYCYGSKAYYRRCTHCAGETYCTSDCPIPSVC